LGDSPGFGDTKMADEKSRLMEVAKAAYED